MKFMLGLLLTLVLQFLMILIYVGLQDDLSAGFKAAALFALYAFFLIWILFKSNAIKASRILSLLWVSVSFVLVLQTLGFSAYPGLVKSMVFGSLYYWKATLNLLVFSVLMHGVILLIFGVIHNARFMNKDSS